MKYNGQEVAISMNRDNHMAIDIAPTDGLVARSQASAYLHRAECQSGKGHEDGHRVYFTAKKYIGSESMDLESYNRCSESQQVAAALN